MATDRGEPIDLTWTTGVRRVQRWRSGHPERWDCRHVTVGQLADGRWWTQITGPTGAPCRAYQTEAQARQVADQLMAHAGGEWVDAPLPAGPAGGPDTGTGT